MSLQTLPAGEIDALRHQLYRFAASKVRDPDVAEDIVQETLMAAMASSGAFEGRSKLRTWLTAILLNKVADHHRATSRRRDFVVCESDQPVNFEDDEEMADGFAARFPDWLSEPSRIVGARQELEVASRALAKLPPRNAKAFVMTDLEGHGTERVCKALGVTESNLWVLLHRTRRALRSGLGAQYA